jgi:hypothetical protein
MTSIYTFHVSRTYVKVFKKKEEKDICKRSKENKKGYPFSFGSILLSVGKILTTR